MTTPTTVIRWLYAFGLRLYPAAFRERFGAQMNADFADGLSDARSAGTGAAGAFLVRALIDLTASLMAQHDRLRDRFVVAGCGAAGAVTFWTAAFGIAARQWPNAPPVSRGAIAAALATIAVTSGLLACLSGRRRESRKPLA